MALAGYSLPHSLQTNDRILAMGDPRFVMTTYRAEAALGVRNSQVSGS
jgi:hypothetical protein